MDEIFQSLGAILKSQTGKLMTVERVNEVFDKLIRADKIKMGESTGISVRKYLKFSEVSE